MNESHMCPDTTAHSGSDAPATYRLVIRAQIVPDVPLENFPEPTHRAPIIWVVVAVAAVLILSWIGISLFGSDPPAPSVANENAQNVPVPAAAPVPNRSGGGAKDLPVPPRAPAADLASAAPSIEAGSTPPQSDEPPTPTREVLPEVPRSALQTIRGTIRVGMRVTIDMQGNVIDVSSEEPGPSRYFERLSQEASRKWAFTSASSDKPRTVLLRFHFTRNGRTAQVVPAQ